MIRRTSMSQHPLMYAQTSGRTHLNRLIAKASLPAKASSLYKSKLGNDLQAAIDVYDARVRWIHNRPVKMVTRAAGLVALAAIAILHPTVAAFAIAVGAYAAIATTLHFATRRAAPDQFHFNGHTLAPTYAALARATCNLVFNLEVVEEMVAGGTDALSFSSVTDAARAPAQVAAARALLTSAEGMLTEGKAVSGALPMSVLCERLTTAANTLAEISNVEMPWSA